MMQVTVAIANSAAVYEHHPVHQGPVPVLDRLNLTQEISELLNMEAVNLPDLFQHFRIISVVGQRMVRLRNADLPIGSCTSFTTEHKGRDASQVGLERHCHEIKHKARVLGEINRNTGRLFD